MRGMFPRKDDKCIFIFWEVPIVCVSDLNENIARNGSRCFELLLRWCHRPHVHSLHQGLNISLSRIEPANLRIHTNNTQSIILVKVELD